MISTPRAGAPANRPSELRYTPDPMHNSSRTVLALALASVLAGCSGQGAKPKSVAEAPVLTGEVSREATEVFVPAWVEEQTKARIDSAAAQALAQVSPGATVTVYFGTWCGDSRREVARLWRALDEVGGEVPFALRWIALDRDKVEPGGRQAGRDILYVPTLIVERDGVEVGRIIETSPQGIEIDLGALLSGKVRGPLSASRPELLTSDSSPN